MSKKEPSASAKLAKPHRHHPRRAPAKQRVLNPSQATQHKLTPIPRITLYRPLSGPSSAYPGPFIWGDHAPSTDHIIKCAEYRVCVRFVREAYCYDVCICDRNMQFFTSQNSPVRLWSVPPMDVPFAPVNGVSSWRVPCHRLWRVEYNGSEVCRFGSPCVHKVIPFTVSPHPSASSVRDVLCPDALLGDHPIPVVETYNPNYFVAVERRRLRESRAYERERLRRSRAAERLQRTSQYSATATSTASPAPLRPSTGPAPTYIIPSESGQYIGQIPYNPAQDHLLKRGEYTFLVRGTDPNAYHIYIFDKDLQVVRGVTPPVHLYRVGYPDKPACPLNGMCVWPSPRFHGMSQMVYEGFEVFRFGVELVVEERIFEVGADYTEDSSWIHKSPENDGDVY